MEPLVIEAAVNGSTSKAAQPHVPRSVEEIVEQAVACFEAGAAIVHHHTDDGLFDGRHASEPYRAAWTAILARVPGAILYPTMGGGSARTTIVERYAHMEELADAGLLRLAVVDPGSVSFGPIDDEGLPAAVDVVYQNTFADVRHMTGRCRERGLAAHVSIFEPGFLRVALAYHSRGRFPPAKIQLYFGGEALPFGLPPTAASVDVYRSMLDGAGLPWMVGVIGGDCASTVAEHAIVHGGHVRVGLEDYAGPRRPTNVELVTEIVALARKHGRRVATAAEAARILRLPDARRPSRVSS